MKFGITAMFLSGINILFACSNNGDRIEEIVDIEESAITLEEGESKQLTFTFMPEDGTVVFSSSDNNVADVSQDGVVTAISAGNALIYAKNGSATDQCTVSVEKPDVRIGDYFYEDGTYSTVLRTDKKVIGIVFQTNHERIGETEKTVLAEKGIDVPHGLVMSLKNAAVGTAAWNSAPVTENIWELKNCRTTEDCNADISGLFNYNAVKAIDEDFSDYPAFKAVADFSVAAPENSTGWFLPSVGQMYDFFANLGGLPGWEEVIDKDSENLAFYWPPQTELVTNLNSYLQELPETDYDKFILNGSDQYFWTSSEVSARDARDWVFHSNGVILCYWNYKTHSGICDVRPILAF